ncbi:MAG: CPBP family intramembrane glutamic endopeptidase [Pyrinomonadaceae bacterium]
MKVEDRKEEISSPSDDVYERNASALSERLIALWEIVSVLASFLIGIWIVLPLAEHKFLVGAIPLSFALLLMLVSHRARRETPQQIGWRMDNFLQAVRLLFFPMLGVAVVIIFIGWRNHSFRLNKLENWEWVAWLFLWGLIQQYALQGFINRRAQIVLGQGYQSALLVAVVFALLHLPNPWLTVATFVGGFIWATVYQRAPNLFALAISHGLMSMLLVWALPPGIMKGLRVGFKYFG